jgi:NTP pyrophosphatase (non-canonical NTP hydrolase)
MLATDYQNLAMRTQADQSLILVRLTELGPKAIQLDGGLRGLVDEVGEIASCVKKWIEYGQPLDRINLQEEVGDALWRLAQIADAAGFTLSDAMQSNISKLRVRYPVKYSDQLAEDDNRNREEEAEAIRQFMEYETGATSAEDTTG